MSIDLLDGAPIDRIRGQIVAGIIAGSLSVPGACDVSTVTSAPRRARASAR